MAHAGGGGIVALRWSRADSANPRANASGASSANETVANAETADCFRVLATGDASGLVAFWTVDRRARPEKIADLRLGMAFPETRAYPQPRRVAYLLAAPRPRDGRGIAAEFRFLVGYARESREGENDDRSSGSAMSAMCAADVRNVPAPDAEPSGSFRRDKPRVESALLFESDEPLVAALGREGGDAAAFSVVTLGADATLRCHAPESSVSSRADGRGSDRNKSAEGTGCWVETLAFKLPVEGVAAEGLAWASEGVLAAVSDKDPSGAVRMFDLESGANCLVRAWDGEPNERGGTPSRDPTSRRLTCVARDADSGALAVGSRDGRVAVFRRASRSFEEDEIGGGIPFGGDETGERVRQSDDARRARRRSAVRGTNEKRTTGRRRRTSANGASPEASSSAETDSSDADADAATNASASSDELSRPGLDERAWRRSATTRVPGATRVVALRFAPRSSRVLSALAADSRDGAARAAARTAHEGQKWLVERSSALGVPDDERKSASSSVTNASAQEASNPVPRNLTAHVLARVRLADKVRDGVSLAHLSGDEVLVESAAGAFAPRAFRSGAGQILGADVAGDALLVWTNKHAETHVYGRDGFERVGRFPHHAPGAPDGAPFADGASASAADASSSSSRRTQKRGFVPRAPVGAQTLALGARGACVFRPGRGAGVVEVCEPGGAPRDALAYDKAHGGAACVDVNDSGAFLSVATLGGYVHSWWLGGRSPARRGAPNGARVPGRETLAPIESVKTNADGSFVLVSFALEPSGSSRVCAYDVELDAWAEFDFAREIGRAVETVSWDCRFPSLFVAQTTKLERSTPSSIDSTKSMDEQTRFREDRDRAGVVAFTCFAARRERDKDETDSAAESVCFVAPQESQVLPDGFDAVLGVAAPCVFVSQKANARRALGDRSAPTAGACFSVCMRDFEGVDALEPNLLVDDRSGADDASDVTRTLLAFYEALARADGRKKSANEKKEEADDEKDSERAFAAAKRLTHPVAWACAGRACVRRKRLDVAELCLSQMGHVRGARAARDAARFAEPDARVAAVATHLGLLEDAERLYRDCGRFDLLANLHRASGRWRDAARVAAARDRVHLKSTHYAHARHLESLGDVAGAVRAYEKSGRAHREVPRLLRARGETRALEAYLDAATRREEEETAEEKENAARLRLWRAKCLESEGDAEGALAEYLACGAFLDATRAYCAAGDLTGAAETVRRAEEDLARRLEGSEEDTKNKSGAFPGPSREHVLAASAFHLARAFEARDAVGEAIAYFSKAGRFGHALRLAMRHGMDGEVARLALKAPQSGKSAADVARFFLKRGDVPRAAALFAEAGSAHAAAELCFEHELLEPLAEIVDRLLRESDSGGGDAEGTSERALLFRRCASWFAERGRFEHAVLLEMRAGNRDAALRLALEKDVAVDEKMADALVGDGDGDGAGADGGSVAAGGEKRNAALLDVARLCKRQGNYALSCKLYAKAGERSKAMKALLKTGDAEKVIFFAGVSRDRDAYVMAANFLQTLDWRGDAALKSAGTTRGDEAKKVTGESNIAKHIVSFYQKAKAHGHLAGFYESCAASEVDDFRDYDAALAALREARRCRAKALAKTEKNAQTDQTRVSREKAHLAAVDAAVDAIGRFCAARGLLSEDPERAAASIRALAADVAKTESDAAPAPVATVRAGDAFAMLVEHAFGVAGDAAAAHAVLVEMRERAIPIAAYVDGDMLRDVARACGKATPGE